MVLFSFFVKPRIHERMFGTFCVRGEKIEQTFSLRHLDYLYFKKTP